MADGNKYLGHILVKGLKGEFEPVINWLEEIFEKIKHLVFLIEKEASAGSILLIM